MTASVVGSSAIVSDILTLYGVKKMVTKVVKKMRWRGFERVTPLTSAPTA